MVEVALKRFFIPKQILGLFQQILPRLLRIEVFRIVSEIEIFDTQAKGIPLEVIRAYPGTKEIPIELSRTNCYVFIA